MRLWYVRRGIPWVPFLACLALVVGAAGAIARWPQLSGGLLPAASGLGAAATGFVLDEPAAEATNVTARGGRWARLARAGVALVPVAIWLIVVETAPAGTHRTGWTMTGLTGQAAAMTLAVLARRRGSATPGALIAPAVAGLTLAPFVIGPILGWNGF